MKRSLLLAVLAASAAGCVSVEGLPDPRGALKPGQRVVVAVYPSPGPWIVGSSDSKAESAAKITPLGFLVQAAEDSRTLSISKNLQQYLPRPHLALAMQETLMQALRAARSTDTVQTALEAGIVQTQLAEWNKAKDQLDWRQRYYAPDPDQPSPRDYARILTLDDALILDVNVSFGTDANEAGNLMPEMTAESRVYRGDTTHLLWEHEDVVAEQTSSSTLTDYQVSPWTLTDSLQKLAPTLGTTIAASFLKAFIVAPSTTGVHIPSSGSAAAPGGGGGLVSMSLFQNLSTATVSGLSPSPLPAAIAASTSAVAGSTAAATATPAVSISTSAPVVFVSTPAVPASSAPALSAPAPSR